VGNLAHFEHKITLFNMDYTIFSLTSGAHATTGGLKPELPGMPPHFNH